jgi:hypothetical protein
MRQLMFSIVLICSLAFSQETTKPLIMVHFMPWYQTPSVEGYWGWHWTMNHFNPESIDSAGHRSIASYYYPLTGPYDSQDSLILEYQTLLMKICGIDGVLVDWWGIDNFADYAVMNESTNKLFAAVERARLSFGIVYEDQTIKHMIDYGYLKAGDALNHGKAALKYLDRNWFGTKTYLKFDNHPVLLVFGPEYFMKTSDWDTLFSDLSLTPLFFTLIDRLAPVAVGSYPWPPMKDCDASGILTQKALNDFLNWFYGQAVGWPYLVASAFPGFHDIYQEAGVMPSLGYLDPMNGFTFKSTLQQALSHRADVIQLVTWNDYGEGTIIEPTVQFGYQYLEIVQATEDSLDPTFPFHNSDLRIPLRVYEARKKFTGISDVNGVLDLIFTLVISGQRDNAVALMDSLSKANGTEVRSGVPRSPDEFQLSQNYPNPFNPSTTIKFELPKASPVGLTVYDILGRGVSVLVNDRRDAGVHEVKFDASGLSSGVYFYRIQAGDFVQTRKLVLIR